MRRILQVFCSFFSGIILTVAISNEILPFGSPLLGLLTLVPLYIALSNSKNFYWTGFLVSVYFFTQHMLSSYWLGFFKDFAAFTLGASAIGTALIGFITGLILHFPFSINGKNNPSTNGGFNRLREYSGLRPFALPLRVITFAAMWTLIEWVKSNGFLGYPWGTLVMTAYKWKVFSQIVDITGTWGITFLFALFSAVIAEGTLKIVYQSNLSKHSISSYANTAAFTICLFVLSSVYGVYQYTRPRITEKTASVVIVQANGNSWTNDNELIAILRSQKLTTRAIEENKSKKPDFVVWNESVISRYYFPVASPFYNRYPEENPLLPYIANVGVPFVIGGPYLMGWNKSEQMQMANAALLFDKDGQLSDYYAKMHLVPFAEYIPFSDNPIVKKILDTIIGFSDGWTPGYSPRLFTIKIQNNDLSTNNNIKIGTPVCFDDAFPSVCGQLFHAGAEMFVNITNDSWSATNSAELQHFIIASFRAIEYRIPLIRSATGGYSVVVDETGRILADLPLFEESSLSIDIPIKKREITIYAQFKDWLPWSLLFFSILYCVSLTILSKNNTKKMTNSICNFSGIQD